MASESIVYQAGTAGAIVGIVITIALVVYVNLVSFRNRPTTRFYNLDWTIYLAFPGYLAAKTDWRKTATVGVTISVILGSSFAIVALAAVGAEAIWP